MNGRTLLAGIKVVVAAYMRDHLKSIRGKDGIDGAPGKDGKNGPIGMRGYTGPIGPVGESGKDGKSITGPIGPSGKDGRDGIDGKPGLRWRGEWHKATEYRKGDVVQWKGDAWVSLKDDVWSEPSFNSRSWDPLVLVQARAGSGNTLNSFGGAMELAGDVTGQGAGTVITTIAPNAVTFSKASPAFLSFAAAQG